jgi:hypothetical protein
MRAIKFKLKKYSGNHKLRYAQNHNLERDAMMKMENMYWQQRR